MKALLRCPARMADRQRCVFPLGHRGVHRTLSGEEWSADLSPTEQFTAFGEAFGASGLSEAKHPWFRRLRRPA